MPRDGRHLHGIQSLLKEPTGGLMPQVMERQALDASGLTNSLKGLRIESGRIPHTRPSIRRGSPSSIVSAVGESGTYLGVPFLVSRRSSACPSISGCSQRIAAISPQRIAVSIAQVMRDQSPAVGLGGC